MDPPTPDVCFLNLYLPPDRRAEVLDELRAELVRAPLEGPVVLGGDINLQLHQPRDAAEDTLAGDLHSLLRTLRCAPVTLWSKNSLF